MLVVTYFTFNQSSIGFTVYPPELTKMFGCIKVNCEFNDW